MSATCVRSVSCGYRLPDKSWQPILEDVSVQFAQAGVHVVRGPSGSGKSTLLSLLAGLSDPSSGDVLICGQRLGDLDESARASFRLRNVGFVFQSFSLFSTLTVLGNVVLPLELQGVPRRQARERARSTLEEIGLTGKDDMLPNALSGGERQRAAIARAMVTNPSVVLADEPTAALDRTSADRVVEAFVREKAGRLIILVTHDERVAEIADRTTRLVDGRVDDPN